MIVTKMVLRGRGVALGWGLSSYLYHPRWSAPLVSLPTRHNAVNHITSTWASRTVVDIPVVLVEYSTRIVI